jgi:hypothetical protein
MSPVFKVNVHVTPGPADRFLTTADLAALKGDQRYLMDALCAVEIRPIVPRACAHCALVPVCPSARVPMCRVTRYPIYPGYRYCHLPYRYCHFKVILHIDTVIFHIDTVI